MGWCECHACAAWLALSAGEGTPLGLTHGASSDQGPSRGGWVRPQPPSKRLDHRIPPRKQHPSARLVRQKEQFGKASGAARTLAAAGSQNRNTRDPCERQMLRAEHWPEWVRAGAHLGGGILAPLLPHGCRVRGWGCGWPRFGSARPAAPRGTRFLSGNEVEVRRLERRSARGKGKGVGNGWRTESGFGGGNGRSVSRWVEGGGSGERSAETPRRVMTPASLRPITTPSRTRRVSAYLALAKLVARVRIGEVHLRPHVTKSAVSTAFNSAEGAAANAHGSQRGLHCRSFRKPCGLCRGGESRGSGRPTTSGRAGRLGFQCSPRERVQPFVAPRRCAPSPAIHTVGWGSSSSSSSALP